MIKYLQLFVCSVTIVLLSSCGESNYIPKPKGFNHIDLPQHAYVQLNEVDKPYTFEYSKFSVAENYMDDVNESQQLYKTIDYKEFGAKVHITYKAVKNSEDTLNSLIDEAYRLANGHNKKAYGIEPKQIVTTSGNIATIIEISGEVPSPYQFFIHDSTTHFMRGVLYFPVATKNDSLRPVINYIKDDMHHLVNTLVWK